MSGRSDQQNVPDHVSNLPISPEEQQNDIRFVDTNRTGETHNDSTGDYLISVLSGILLRSDKFGDTDCVYKSQGRGLLSIARLSLDGQMSMSFDLKKHLPDFLPSQILTQEVEEFAVDHERWRDCPSMNIVIMIVGSRGESWSTKNIHIFEIGITTR